MQIINGIEICELGIVLKEYNTLVVSDLQIGYEQSIISNGFLVPKFQFSDIKKVFKKMISGRKYDKIIINGDFKHEFGKISEQEWREALLFINLVSKKCDELIFIKGNHDNLLEPIAKKRNIKLVESYLLGEFFLVHGDKMVKIPKGVKTIIIGHEHPALGLRQEKRIEKYKCFLKGKFKNYNLIVLPSINPLIPGTDVMQGKFMSPFFQDDINDFEVYVVEDKIYYFGKIKNIEF